MVDGMRIGLSRPAAAAMLAAAALLAAACGESASLTAAGSGQAVASALEAARTTPLRAAFTASLALQTAGVQGLPAKIQSQLSQLGGGGSASGTLLQQSGSRRELRVTAQGHTYDLVQYDGHGYVRTDGGAWAELASTLPATPAPSGSQISAAVAALGFSDRGPASVDGVATQRYRATLTTARLTTLIEDLGASASAGAGSGSSLMGDLALLSPYVTLSHATADVWVSTRNGSLVRAQVGGSVAVDLGAISAALAGLGTSQGGTPPRLSGTLGATLSLSVQVSDYGGSVTVTRPHASTTLPAAPASGWTGCLPAAGAASGPLCML